MGESEPGKAKVNLILRLSGQSVSLLVDEVEDVLAVSDELFESPPANLDEDRRSLISATYKLPERLLLLIDVLRVVESVGWVAPSRS